MNEFDELSANGIIFNKRPDSIPYKHRISYRVTLIVLIIKICSSRKECPLVKFHIINDAMENRELINNIKRCLKRNSSEFAIRFDSSLNRAIEYAIADGLIIQQGNKTYKLSVTGRDFANRLLKDSEILRNEKERLEKINTELDEKTLNSILNRWREAYDSYK